MNAMSAQATAPEPSAGAWGLGTAKGVNPETYELAEADFETTLHLKGIRVPKAACNKAMGALRGYTLNVPRVR